MHCFPLTSQFLVSAELAGHQALKSVQHVSHGIRNCGVDHACADYDFYTNCDDMYGEPTDDAGESGVRDMDERARPSAWHDFHGVLSKSICIQLLPTSWKCYSTCIRPFNLPYRLFSCWSIYIQLHSLLSEVGVCNLLLEIYADLEPVAIRSPQHQLPLLLIDLLLEEHVIHLLLLEFLIA